MSCRYAIPDALLIKDLGGSALEEIVEKAFSQAILEHSLFQVGLIDENSKKPSWVQLDRIDLHNHIEWRTISEDEDHEKALQEVLEWRISNPFTHLESRPHWTAVILRPTHSKFLDIVFAWEHTAGDGKSGKIFHQSLLKCLNSETGGKKTEPLKDRSFKVPPTALIPPLDKMLKIPISAGFLLKEGLQSIIPPRDADSPYTVTWAPVQSSPVTSRLCYVVLDEDALQAVLKACRQHQTTLTGLIHALTLVSMASRIPSDRARAFQIGTPLCVRRFVRPNPEEYPGLDMEQTVTNSVAYWTYKFDEGTVSEVRQQISNIKARGGSDADLEATMWSAATTLKQAISKKLKQGLKNDMLGLTKYVSDWRSFIKDQSKLPRTTSWEISNLGVITRQAENQKEVSDDSELWTIERAIFTQSAVVAGAAITMNPIAVKGKGLTMTLVWQSEVVDAGIVRDLASDLETWLMRLGKGERISLSTGAETTLN